MILQRRKIADLVLNQRNPRKISNKNIEKLKKSISEFPQMLEIRPVVINNQNIVLGGNARVKAAMALGFDEIPVIVANLTKLQEKEFIAKDNLNYGEWDWHILLEEYEKDELIEWGFDDSQFQDLQITLPDDLLREDKMKPPKITITFANNDDLKHAQPSIEAICKQYKDCYYSLSSGEI